MGGLAVALASAVNTQQSLGLDLGGALGGNLFSVGGPSVLAAASNTGSGTLTAAITNTNAFTPGNYIVAKTASGYQATDTATGQVSALGNGPTLGLDGMSVAVSGTINTGDSFELEPTASAAQTLAVTATDPGAIAAAAAYVATPGNNLGNVTAGAFSAAASSSLAAGTAIVPASYFGQNLTVKFTSATAFNVLSPGNAVIASGTFSAANGAQIAIAYPPYGAARRGHPGVAVSRNAGDGRQFLADPGGIGSNGNMVAMAGLANQNLLSGQTLTSAYSTLVGQVGSAGDTANFTAQAAQGVLSQVQSVQQSISGVNLDEQAADLVTYQQAYQAAAQVIASAQTLFADLLTAVQRIGAAAMRIQHQRVPARLAQRSAGAAAERQSAQPRDRHRPDHARRGRRSGRCQPGHRPRQPGRLRFAYDTANGQAATQSLQNGVSTLQQLTNVLAQLRQTVTAAANGTTTQSDRESDINSAQALLQQLVQLANTQGTNGGYLFAGSKSNGPAFRDAAGRGQVVAGNGDQPATSPTRCKSRRRSMSLRRFPARAYSWALPPAPPVIAIVREPATIAYRRRLLRLPPEASRLPATVRPGHRRDASYRHPIRHQPFPALGAKDLLSIFHR